MGANDSCNDWGPAVGAGTVKLWQAYLLSGIFNTVGAILLGKHERVIKSGEFQGQNREKLGLTLFGHANSSDDFICCRSRAFWVE